MKQLIITAAIMLAAMAAQAKTLIVYYSYTNNVERIVDELSKQIDADVIEIEPAEKGLDYAADNYAIGSAQIAAIRENPDIASSYPAIDPVDVDLAQYSTVIIGAPLWWSNMAAPMQTFLFNYGAEMAGKNIGLIVSSASSGISGVEGDAKRLIPDGDFLSPSLWIRSSQVSNAKTMLADWLKEINYSSSETPDMTDNKIILKVGDGTTLTATLKDNSSAEAMLKLLESGSVTISMHDYANMEKVGSLPESLPRNDTYFTTGPGDLVLYLGNQFVIYYDNNSYNFTHLGKIDGDYTGLQLKSILGDGDVTVTLSSSASSGIEEVDADYSDAGHSDLYNLAGQKVTENGNLPKGIYILKGAGGKNRQVKKIML